MNEVTLREHIEAQIKWVDRYFVDQIKAIESKTAIAAQQIDRRLEGMNEFRDQLKDQAANFMTRSESQLARDALSERIKVLELSKAATDGKTVVWSTLAAVAVSILVAVVSRWIMK